MDRRIHKYHTRDSRVDTLDHIFEGSLENAGVISVFGNLSASIHNYQKLLWIYSTPNFSRVIHRPQWPSSAFCGALSPPWPSRVTQRPSIHDPSKLLMYTF